jgi:hypothetical protein
MERVAARASADRRLGSPWGARICAWCGHSVPARPDEPEAPASHGICQRCLAGLLAELQATPDPDARARSASGDRKTAWSRS